MRGAPNAGTMAIRRLAISTSALLFAATGASAAGGGRILTTSDVVAIRVVDHPELETTTRIEPDGTINFPYVGRIKAAGGLPASDPERERVQIARLRVLAEEAQLDPAFAEKFLNFLVAEVIHHHEQIARTGSVTTSLGQPT